MNSNPETKSFQSLREENILLFWEREDIFKKTLEKESPMGDFVFFEGPPTANGRPGIHHVEARSFKDIIPRYKTMRGFRVRRKAGWDTHGLPVEIQTEKKLGLQSKKEIESYGLAEFNRQCRESVWEYKDEWEHMTRRMGYWLDLDDPYITYNNSYIEGLWGVVKKIHERGHLYKDFRVVPWCTRCGTTLSSHELNQPGAYKDVKDLSVYVKFKLITPPAALGATAYLVAWTTTPWTLPGNVALAVGNDIEYVAVTLGTEVVIVAKERLSLMPEEHTVIAEYKGSDLVGLQYEPLYPFLGAIANDEQKAKLENAFKVVPADFVTTTDGTGIVHIAPMYGADDFEVGTAHNLPKVHTVAENGTFVSGTEFLAGRYAKEADPNGKPTLAVDIVNDLKERNLWFKQETHKHSYPHCWRCDTPLLYYAHRSWYFRMSGLRQQLLDANNTINWEPKHVKEGRFGEWLDGVKDWNISRDRFWGTPLPIWETLDGEQRVVVGSVEDIKKYTKNSGNKFIMMRHGEAESNTNNICSGNPENNHPLTDAGRAMVTASAQQLKEQGITKIIASPNMRTQQTAQLVADVVGIPHDQIVTDVRIKEFDFGDFEMQPFQNFEAYRDAHMNTMDDALPNGESMQDVKNRVGAFLYEVHATHRNETLLIVTHGIVTEVLPAIAKGLDAQQSRAIVPKGALEKGAFREVPFTPLPHNSRYELDMHKPYIDQIELEIDGQKLVRVPEVMDVWFDSGSMPFAQDHQLGQAMQFNPAPADYISEGMDQTRGWFYTMHAVANLVHDNPTVAYKNVVCLGLILDAEGVKMSKSRGNVVNPWSMFDAYGADALRFWMYSINQPGDSKNFDEKTVDEVVKKVFNLLANVVKFYDMFKEGDTGVADYRQSPHVLDQWIIALTDQLVTEVTENLEHYRMMEASRAIREYAAELSQWYIRRSRDRFKSDDESDRAYALATTREVLLTLAKVMAPFTPFFAEDMYQQLRHEHDVVSVHLADWPEARAAQTDVLDTMATTRALVSQALEARSKAGIKIRQPLQSVTLNTELPKDYADILADELNVKEVLVADQGDAVVLDTTITPTLRREGQFRELLRGVQDLRKTMGLVQSDRVALVVETSSEGMEIVYQFKDELIKTAGITTITTGAGEHSITADGATFAVTLVR